MSAGSKGGAGPRVRKLPAAGMRALKRLPLRSLAAGTARVGEKLVMEVINKSDKKVYFALVEVGASASFAVFHPSGPLPAVLKPGRTFRLPSVFTAARPLGPYMYYVVASTDASPWWRKSRSMWGDGAGLLLGQALHNQPPAAAIYWDRAVWAVASTPLVIRAAR